MNHPDFRIEGKIFATLGYPDESCGMVKLTPEQQQSFIHKSPGVFNPCAGVWGQRGATSVCLALVKKSILNAALHAALKNVTSQAKKKQSPATDACPLPGRNQNNFEPAKMK